MRIDVDEVCREVLARHPSEGDVEEHVRAVCRRHFGDESEDAADAVMGMIRSAASGSGTSELKALKALSKSQAEVSRQEWSSVEEMPPELKEKFEKMFEAGNAMHSQTQENIVKLQSIFDSDTDFGKVFEHDLEPGKITVSERNTDSEEPRVKSRVYGDLAPGRQHDEPFSCGKLVLVVLLALIGAAVAAYFLL